MAVYTFPLSLQLLLVGSFSCILPPSPSCLCMQKWLPALCDFSPHHVPSEFFGLGCADCCVNPQIRFLGVQDGLVLIWLYLMDARHTTKLLYCSTILAPPQNSKLFLMFIGYITASILQYDMMFNIRIDICIILN